MSQTYYTIDENHVNREEILDNLLYKLHDEEWLTIGDIALFIFYF